MNFLNFENRSTEMFSHTLSRPIIIAVREFFVIIHQYWKFRNDNNFRGEIFKLPCYYNVASDTRGAIFSYAPFPSTSPPAKDLSSLYRVIITCCCVHSDIHGRRPWIINNYGSSGRKTLFTLKLTTCRPCTSPASLPAGRPDAFVRFMHVIIIIIIIIHVYIYTYNL